MTLGREGSLLCHSYCDTGPRLLFLGFFLGGLIRTTAPFSHLLRLARGCRGLILTLILAGPHSETSYDTQKDAEDLLLPGSSRVNNILKILWCVMKLHALCRFSMDRSCTTCVDPTRLCICINLTIFQIITNGYFFFCII
jgi:hypothetical protein